MTIKKKKKKNLFVILSVLLVFWEILLLFFFFFFFFFYSHLTPHSPTGMAGGLIRTPTQGANYIYTKQNP